MRTPRPLALAAALLALLAVAVAAPPAEARTKRFLPLHFTPMNTGSDYTLSPIAVGALGTSANFSALLGLPTGARITGVRLYSNGVASSRVVRVRKVSYGQPAVTMAEADTAIEHADPLTPMVTVGTTGTPPENVVEPGYLYYVAVACTPLTAVWAVDIEYTP